ncbi:lysozyme C-like [Spea bombifrons]|uniref:lysozyme C-like n=1 Tax=Spea bombifrons TaxID=233779 RepID=UPI00234AEF82|nr:lysozyme C-like [Spea bombifrons]
MSLIVPDNWIYTTAQLDLHVKQKTTGHLSNKSSNMKGVLYLAILISVIIGTHGKRYAKCELLKRIKDTKLDVYSQHSAANWVCLAKHESDYSTTAINDNGPSRDYGIFQINSKWWCDDGKTPGSKNACGISCHRLLDDNILDDIECAKRVVSDPNGMGAWVAWRKKCKGKDLSPYTAGC